MNHSSRSTFMMKPDAAMIERLRVYTYTQALERAVIEAAISKRHCDLEVERLEAQRSAANSSSPDFQLLEKIVSAGASAYKTGTALEDAVDALIAARENQ